MTLSSFPDIGIDWVGRGVIRARVVLALGLLCAAAPALAQVDPALDTRSPAFRTAALPSDPFAGDQGEIPAALTPSEAATYRRILGFQERGEWQAADREIAKLNDKLLLGHVLADRYLSAGYRSTQAELTAWLESYAELPQAGEIYQLAIKRAPRPAKPAKGAKAAKQPPRPAVKAPPPAAPALAWGGDEMITAPEPAAPAGRRLPPDMARRAQALKNDVSGRIRAGELDLAEGMLGGGRDIGALLTDAEVDLLRTRIAAGYFAQGEDERAYRLASTAAARSGHAVTRSNWIAGLAAFRLDRLDDAGRHFETLALTPNGSAWDIAAGAFWAGRVHLHANRMAQVGRWFDLAGQYPRTFYGLLARHVRGQTSGFNWNPPAISPADARALLRSPAGARALGLIQIGEPALAEAELQRVYVRGDDGQNRVLLAVALRGNLPGLAMRLGRSVGILDGQRYDAALYPLPPWKPVGGFTVDRALVFALARQESAFNPRAQSPAGARGLMQIMPQTASYVMRQGTPTRNANLFDPVTSLTLGQRYIELLLENEAVQGDLIRLAAAYNGGPGNLARWTRSHDERATARPSDHADDALVFIESIPAPETRHFITRVLFNYWLYSERLGLPMPTLDALARGNAPIYAAVDTAVSAVAMNAKTR